MGVDEVDGSRIVELATRCTRSCWRFADAETRHRGIGEDDGVETLEPRCRYRTIDPSRFYTSTITCYHFIYRYVELFINENFNNIKFKSLFHFFSIGVI